MTVQSTASFARDFLHLPEDIQRKVETAIRQLVANPRHPSLRVKKMKGVENRWEARITRSYRFTFSWEGDEIILRRLGTHDILLREG